MWGRVGEDVIEEGGKYLEDDVLSESTFWNAFKLLSLDKSDGGSLSTLTMTFSTLCRNGTSRDVSCPISPPGPRRLCFAISFCLECS
jgi:hypothetical protein